MAMGSKKTIRTTLVVDREDVARIDRARLARDPQPSRAAMIRAAIRRGARVLEQEIPTPPEAA